MKFTQVYICLSTSLWAFQRSICIAVSINFMVSKQTWNSQIFWHPSGFYKIKASKTFSFTRSSSIICELPVKHVDFGSNLLHFPPRYFHNFFYKSVLRITENRQKQTASQSHFPLLDKLHLKMIKKSREIDLFYWFL